MIEENVLKDLFITNNMTRKEVADYLCVPESQVKHYLALYKILKPKELKNIINKKTNSHTKGKKWFNNGIIETLADKCPEGFIAGKLKSTSEKISEALKGHTISTETKEKIKKKALGRQHSITTKAKISLFMNKNHPFKGKHHTEDTKRLIKEKRAKQIIKTPISDLIVAFLDNNYEKYIKNNIINLEEIFKNINIEDNGNNRKLIYNYYRVKGYEISFGLNHKSENLLNDFISSSHKGTIIRDTRQIIKGFELDFYFPELKLAIEYNGNYWHSINKKGLPVDYHYKKSLACREQGIRLIHIWEDQWNNTRLRPILEGIIKNALKYENKDIKRIYARKCEIRELDSKLYKDFCSSHHTQLSRPAEVRLGLFYDNELVQVASFSHFKARNGLKVKKVNYEWEFIRGCESFNHSRVIGGVSKLLNYFINKYNPKSILCYSDFNLFCGVGYEQSGFKLDGFTGPDKFFIDETGNRINRQASKYREFKEKVDSGKWLLCCGAGSLRFIWKKETEA